MFKAAKDALAGRAAQVWANRRLARYGRVQDLKIDSRRKTVAVTCLLVGEPAAITITVENYVVESHGARRWVRATRFRCARPWLQNVLADFGARQRFEVPRWVAAAL